MRKNEQKQLARNEPGAGAVRPQIETKKRSNFRAFADTRKKMNKEDWREMSLAHAQ
jgi:hypothetical protein